MYTAWIILAVFLSLLVSISVFGAPNRMTGREWRNAQTRFTKRNLGEIVEIHAISLVLLLVGISIGGIYDGNGMAARLQDELPSMYALLMWLAVGWVFFTYLELVEWSIRAYARRPESKVFRNGLVFTVIAINAVSVLTMAILDEFGLSEIKPLVGWTDAFDVVLFIVWGGLFAFFDHKKQVAH